MDRLNNPAPITKAAAQEAGIDLGAAQDAVEEAIYAWLQRLRPNWQWYQCRSHAKTLVDIWR